MNTTQEKINSTQKETSTEADPALSEGLSEWGFVDFFSTLGISEDKNLISLGGSPWVKMDTISILPWYPGACSLQIRVKTLEDLKVLSGYFNREYIFTGELTSFDAWELKNTWHPIGSGKLPHIYCYEKKGVK